MKQNNLRVISAKDLGKLKLADFCPRCFWLERHLGKPPSLFPSIFSSLDAVTKRSVHRAFSRAGRLPDWLPFEDVTEVEEGDTLFKMPRAAGGWVLTGRPDDVFRLQDGTYQIADYKTAKFTARQDELYPMYEVQLNCYAFMAQEYGFTPVTKLTLVYCQPREDLDDDKDFRLSFGVNVLDIGLNLAQVEDLLQEARSIVGAEQPPQAKPECKGICCWASRCRSRA